MGFHFDPMIGHDGWEESYRDLVNEIFSRVDTRRVAWVSLGSLRLTTKLITAIREREERGVVLTGELVPTKDGKHRLWQGLRTEMYRSMLAWLREIDAEMPRYICMESESIWQSLFDRVPTDRQVADSLVSA